MAYLSENGGKMDWRHIFSPTNWINEWWASVGFSGSLQFKKSSGYKSSFNNRCWHSRWTWLKHAGCLTTTGSVFLKQKQTVCWAYGTEYYTQSLRPLHSPLLINMVFKLCITMLTEPANHLTATSVNLRVYEYTVQIQLLPLINLASVLSVP